MLNGLALRDSRETAAFTLGMVIESSNQMYKLAFYSKQCLFVLCGGLIISKLWLGSLISFFLLVLNFAFVSNPFVPRKGLESEMMWCLCIKLLALLGGILLLLTKGKITDNQ